MLILDKLRKLNEEIETDSHFYKFISTGEVTFSPAVLALNNKYFDEYDKLFPTNSFGQLIYSDIDNIKEIIMSEATKDLSSDNIVDYLDGEPGLVTNIELARVESTGTGFEHTWVITTSSILSNEQKEAITAEIMGQLSDGWGEGFEQKDIPTTVIVQGEIEVDGTPEKIDTQVNCDINIHFWTPESIGRIED